MNRLECAINRLYSQYLSMDERQEPVLLTKTDRFERYAEPNAQAARTASPARTASSATNGVGTQVLSPLDPRSSSIASRGSSIASSAPSLTELLTEPRPVTGTSIGPGPSDVPRPADFSGHILEPSRMLKDTFNDYAYLNRYIDLKSLGRIHLPAQAPGSCSVQVLRSAGDWSLGVGVENSIQRAYTRAIETAEHLIYIESQYLISSYTQVIHHLISSFEPVFDIVVHTAQGRIELLSKATVVGGWCCWCWLSWCCCCCGCWCCWCGCRVYRDTRRGECRWGECKCPSSTACCACCASASGKGGSLSAPRPVQWHQ
jgi:hypothetical protein